MTYVDLFINNIIQAAIAKDTKLLREHIDNALNLHIVNNDDLNAASLLPAVCDDFDTCLFLIDHGAFYFDIIAGAIRANKTALLNKLIDHFKPLLKQLIDDSSDQTIRVFNYFAASAAHAGNLRLVLTCLERLPNNKRDYMFVAGSAACAGQFDIANKLINCSNVLNINHIAMMACRGGHGDYASVLLSSLPEAKRSFFMMAIGFIKAGLLEDALFAASKVNDPYCYLNLAIESAGSNRPEFILAFLQNQVLNKEIVMRLMAAAIKNGHLDIVEFLLNQNWDIEIDWNMLSKFAEQNGHRCLFEFCNIKLKAIAEDFISILSTPSSTSTSPKRKRDAYETSSNEQVDGMPEPKKKKARRDPLENTTVQGNEMQSKFMRGIFIYDFNRKTKSIAKAQIGTLYVNPQIKSPRKAPK